MTTFESLSLGFRSRFLTYDELTEQVRRWADAFPEVVLLRSIGRSDEGREMWLVTIGRDPTRKRPAAWLDGNIHSSELAGSSVCLGIIEDLLRAHAGEPLVDLPAHVTAWLKEDVLVHVLPRMCPDGAERVMTHGHFVRSNHRDHRHGNHGPYWRHEDVDGDGRSLLMRVRDETGDFVESSEVENLMLPRRVEDLGPYYRVYPEGVIERWDGVTVPVPHFMSDVQTDMNRNFPTDWRPEPEQLGAGEYPMSEPESRAVVEFAAKNPNIFVWLCMHTFGGVYIRPLNDAPDTKMHSHDASVFRQVESWAESLTGYPTVSGFAEFTYEPEKPLHGDLANFAYADRGAIGFVCELWDFFRQVGFEVKRPFIKNYEERTSARDILQIARWDRENNGGRIIGTWRKVTHPQLGEVEVGGYDPLVGIWNPPFDRLGQVCTQQSQFFFRLAAMAPRIKIARVDVEPLGSSRSLVSVVVENHGYLPSFVLGSAKSRQFSDPVHARLEGEGIVCESPSASQRVGHLAGWGGNDRSTSPALMRSIGEAARGRVSWVVRGAGEISIEVGSARTGHISRRVTLEG